jgi:predicted MPP superfamily phosphohydrolase
MSGDVLTRREFLKVTLGSAAFTSAMGCGAVAYGNLIEAYDIEVAQVSVKLPRLAPEFHGYRLVQISDIHMGTWMTRDHLHTIVRLVNAQMPDLVAVTGDFVTVEPVERWAGDLVPPLQDLTPRAATVATLGNHDHWTNHQVVRDVIRDSGMLDVNNGVYTLQRGSALLHIAGVDDYWERKSDLDLVLRQPRLRGGGAAGS